MNEFFSNNLRKIRESKRLTQTEVAISLGIGKSTYSQYESGKREPNLDTLKAIADLLGVSVDVLLSDMNDTVEVGDEIISRKLFDKVMFEMAIDDSEKEFWLTLSKTKPAVKNKILEVAKMILELKE